MNVELLVSLVSEHKGLYDKCGSDYKNLDKRELWRGTVAQIGFDVYRGISVFIKRHLMSGSEFARSLGSATVKIVWV